MRTGLVQPAEPRVAAWRIVVMSVARRRLPGAPGFGLPGRNERRRGLVHKASPCCLVSFKAFGDFFAALAGLSMF